MSIKSILCLFNGQESERRALRQALALAKIHQAHVRVLHIMVEPLSHATLYGYGAYPDLIEMYRRENAQFLKKAKKEVVKYATEAGLPIEEPNFQTSTPYVEFMGITDIYLDQIIALGRLSDLIVMAHQLDNPQTSFNRSMILSTLFSCGRPVLLVPTYVFAPETYSSVAVAWKNSLEASRALHIALPLLKLAKRVCILTAQEEAQANMHTTNPVQKYLSMHGIEAEVKVIENSGSAAADTLLQEAKDLGMQLLVMGAYGHSRMQETLLGGVTQRMLEMGDMSILLVH